MLAFFLTSRIPRTLRVRDSYDYEIPGSFTLLFRPVPQNHRSVILNPGRRATARRERVKDLLRLHFACGWKSAPGGTAQAIVRGADSAPASQERNDTSYRSCSVISSTKTVATLVAI